MTLYLGSAIADLVGCAAVKQTHPDRVAKVLGITGGERNVACVSDLASLIGFSLESQRSCGRRRQFSQNGEANVVDCQVAN